MTTEEFKSKYVHLAHLEGNALWDAMSMAVFVENGSKVVKTKEDLAIVLNEKFVDGSVFEDRFKNFEILVPVDTAAGEGNIQYDLKPECVNDVIKDMSFDELSVWAKSQPARTRKK